MLRSDFVLVEDAKVNRAWFRVLGIFRVASWCVGAQNGGAQSVGFFGRNFHDLKILLSHEL